MVRLFTLRLTGIGAVAAIGGGIAGALLSMLTLQHPPLTLVMGFAAPLPLMIASMAFGPLAGAISIVVGAVFIGLFDVQLGQLALNGLQAPQSALLDAAIFLVTLGVPSLVLTVAARGQGQGIATTPTSRPEERLLGRIVLGAVVFAALAVSLVFVVAIVDNGGFDAFQAMLQDAFRKTWQSLSERRTLPKELDAGQFARQLTWLMPPLMSAASVFFYLCNLWIAARIAQTSNALGSPWPDIPRNMRLPRFSAVILAVALGLSFTGGIFGLVMRTISAALIAAFAIQGLAVIHAMTRHRGSRTATLVLVYLSLAVLLPWPLLFWGGLGLVDLAFSFRDRQRPVVIRKP